MFSSCTAPDLRILLSPLFPTSLSVTGRERGPPSGYWAGGGVNNVEAVNEGQVNKDTIKIQGQSIV